MRVPHRCTVTRFRPVPARYGRSTRASRPAIRLRRDRPASTRKFHTHVHVPDLAGRRIAVPSTLSRFDRLALIEPYAVVVWDLARRWLADSPQSIRVVAAGQAWIAKGLSGALNFVVPAHSGSLRFDFAPRVISTSGATKVISTEPTIIRKDRGLASAAERRRMGSFHRAVVAGAANVRPVPRWRGLWRRGARPQRPGWRRCGPVWCR